MQRDETGPPPEGGEPMIGFGGAVVRSLDDLPERSPGDACFFGVDRELCRVFGGSNEGAAVFIRSGSARMRPWTRRERPAAVDVGVLRSPPKQLLEEVALLGADLSARGFLPVAVGCDHTVSYAHAMGVCSRQRATYVYFDAHLDLGLHDDRSGPAVHNGNFVASLVRGGKLDQVVNVGARAWTTYDDVYEAETGVSILREGSDAELAFLRGRDVYVSLDMDVIDPAFVPNTCCREPFGMSPQDVLRALGWIRRHCRVIGADVSELAPDARLTHTAEIAMRCAHELTGNAGERAEGAA